VSSTTKIEGFVWPAGLRPEIQWMARSAFGGWSGFCLSKPEGGVVWHSTHEDEPYDGIDLHCLSLPEGNTPILLWRDDYVQTERLPHCDICARGVVDFAAENIEPQWHTLEDAGCELTLCQDCWADEQRASKRPCKTVSFVGRCGGYGILSHWQDVAASDASAISGHSFGQTHLFLDDISRHLGIVSEDGKRRRFTIIVEDVE